MYTCWRKRLWPGTLNARTRNGLESTISPRKKDSFQAQFHDWDWDLSFCFTSLWAWLGFDFFLYMCVPKSYQMIYYAINFIFGMLAWCSRWVQKNEWTRSLKWTERENYFSGWMDWRGSAGITKLRIEYVWHMLLLKDFAPQHYILVPPRRESHVCTSLYTLLQPPPLFSFNNSGCPI